MKRHLIASLSVLAAAIVSAGFVTQTAENEPIPASSTPVSLPGQDPVIWKVDKAHSNVNFTITHLVVSEVDGNFKVFEGTVETTKEDFSDAKISFTVDASSINTNNEGRDKHLRSADFFDTEKYPQITFRSTSFKPVGGKKYVLTGVMKIKDVAREVTFDVTYNGQHDSGRGIKAGFKAKTTIDRTEFGIKGSPTAVGKEVEISLNIALAKSA